MSQNKIDDLVGAVFVNIRRLQAYPEFPHLTRGVDLYEKQLQHTVVGEPGDRFAGHLITCEKCRIRRLLGLPEER